MTKQEFLGKWTEKLCGDWIHIDKNNRLALDTASYNYETWKEFFKDYELFIKENN